MRRRCWSVWSRDVSAATSMLTAIGVEFRPGHPDTFNGVATVGFTPRARCSVASDGHVYAMAEAITPEDVTQSANGNWDLPGYWYDLLHEGAHAALLRVGIPLDVHEDTREGYQMALEHALVRSVAPRLSLSLRGEHRGWGMFFDETTERQISAATHDGPSRDLRRRLALRAHYKNVRANPAVLKLFTDASISPYYMGGDRARPAAAG